jgi:hypothetical protein
MPLVPNAQKPPTNEFTKKLFELIDEACDNTEAIDVLLQASSLLLSNEKLRKTAVNFFEMMDETENNEKKCATVLDLTIIDNKSQYFDMLCAYIFDNPHINKTDKNIALNLAIMRAINFDKINYLFKLLERQPGYELTQTQSFVHYTNCYSPITVAVVHNKLEALSILLLNNADPTVPDQANNTALKLALDKPDNTANKQKMIAMIKCAIELQAAVKAFESQDAALTSTHVSAALQLDQNFTRNYLKTIAWRAVSQLSGNQDSTDYRFVLEFSRIYTAILRSPVNSNRKYVGESEFQNDVIVHLIGSYDCEKIGIPPDVRKLFHTNKEKLEFFSKPITTSLIEGANVGATLGTMVERASLANNAQPQALALAASMARSDILAAPNTLPLAQGGVPEKVQTLNHQ